MKKFFLIAAALLLLAVNSAKAADKWITAYYTNWQTAAYPTNRIDYTAVTHIALAHWLTNSNGTIQSSGWDSTCSSIVVPAHAAGVKVLMMLGGSDDVNFPSAASPSYQATLISSIQAKISACGLDGVDLDWEDSVNTTNFISLAKNLRAASSAYIITAPVDPTVQPGSLAASLSAYSDQVNMMTYGNANLGNGWVSWYFSALAGDSSDHPSSVAKFVTDWEDAGTPSAKIGVGIGFYMNGWTAPVTGALQSTSGSSVPVQELPYGWSLANGGGLLSCYYNQPAGTYQYDPSPDLNIESATPPEQPSIKFMNGIKGASPCPTNSITWATYEDEASVAAKARYIVDNNLGGAIIWTLQEGAVDPATGRNPLLDSLKLNLNLNGAGPAAMPQVGYSGAASVAGPTTIPVTGLPTNLGLVDIKWWNYTSAVAWDATSDPGYQTYGQPSAYTIQGSTNGTTWTTLSCTPSCNITGEHYTGRQFVADLTGTGYTQIRMNISSMVGTNAGYDVLTVNGRAGTNDSNDTYLMFGDSITANCWGATPSTGPTEQLGTQIHAARPSQFPVSTVGGQSGWLTSTALDTSTYGIPNIQKFLQDIPAVKYVGISLGTNDANGNVAADTYCSNMQKIVQYVIASGKTPIIPTIVASPSAAVQANAPAMNACLATLEQNYPSIIVGPDLWTLFKGHSTSDGWFFDTLHPSLGTGCTALQNAWTNKLLTAIYPNNSNTPPTPPSVPTGLAATASTSTQVNLTWNGSTDPNYPTSSLTYTLYRNGAVVATTASGVTSYSDTGLAVSTTYTYTISASDPAGNTSAPSGAVNVTTPAAGGGTGGGTPPVRRGGCAAEANNLPTQCTISGVQSGDEILVGFLAEYGASGATISFSDNCGGTYTILNQQAVQAGGAGVVVEGQGYGVGSAGTCTISATSTSGGGPGEIVADDITAGKLDTYGWLPDVSTTANGATSFSLHVNAADYIFSWATDVFGNGGSLTVASPFSIENSNLAFPIYDADATTTGAATPASTWTFSSTTSGTIGAIAFSGSGSSKPTAPVITSPLTASGTVGSAFSYQISATGSPTSYGATNLPAGLSVNTPTGLISGTPTASGKLSSTISATNSGGNGSATVVITIASAVTPDTTAPTVPTGLSATAVSSSQVHLSWNASTDPDNTASQITYNIYRNGQKITTTSGGATTYSDSGLAANTTYAYTVSASDPAGNTSAQSVAVTATTLAASGAIPQRVRGCSAETGSAKASCVLTGVTAGDILIVGATSLEAGTSPLTFSDNCGGRYTVLDTTNISSNAIAQGYGTGSSGTCTVTAQTVEGWATTLVVEEITPSTVDVHGWNQNFSVSAGNTASATITTSSLDYVFSWAVDEAGDGGAHMTVASPFVVHDFNNVFPIVDADTAQSAGGTITATWKFNANTSHAAIGMVGFH